MVLAFLSLHPAPPRGPPPHRSTGSNYQRVKISFHLELTGVLGDLDAAFLIENPRIIRHEETGLHI